MKIQYQNIFLLIFSFIISFANAQTSEELKAEKGEIQSQIHTLQGQVGQLQSRLNAINNELEIMGGWTTGAFGTMGFNLSRFNNWIKGANPNAVSSTILGTFSGFANKKTETSFFRNNLNLNLGWQKLDINTADGDPAKYEKIADVLRINSIYGRNLSKKFALSALGEYNTALLTHLNNPGILDIGAGFTLLPVQNLILVLHPLNYHWVFGDNPAFSSALGTKMVADYVRTFPGGLTWRSNLTGFLPYTSQEPTLREYTWVNGLSFSAWKGIGVGIEYAFRNAAVEFNGMQSYFIVGLSYSL
ncbi:MAG TPA: DUF3078 domain-containing protein [Saprospiraceae bacterium]|nr:DUF3078 domain-containing protein [Saprospiraceae bacterium]